jgi:hypothetical protein
MTAREAKTSLKIGDEVRPRPEWRDDPNCVPHGRVREV